MGTGRLLIGVGAAVAASGALLFGGSSEHALRPVAIASEAHAANDQGSLGQLLAGFSTGDTATFVRGLERRVRLNPHDGQTLTLLGLAYQQRARETGDPAYYGLSGKALARAAKSGGPKALLAQADASLANTRHRFRDGLALARRAVRLDRYNASAYGALGDAQLNLGRYTPAFAAYDRMAVLAPGIAGFARVANARELRGHPEGAIEALQLALEADSTVPEQVAWTQVQLGNVRFNMGRLELAADAYRLALRHFPGYVHAQAGLARVEAARGHYAVATRLLEHVVGVLPLPAYVILLGDVRHAAGDQAGARREYSLVHAIERLFEANGVRTELQTALFDLDHGHDVPAALARARSAYASAPGVYAEDALAWGLYRSGRCAAAREHSAHALRLGTRDGLLIFHRGMIERCLGNRAATTSFLSRALEINPHFSLLWAPVARRALR
jgi:tetratricopeptide (TPR) repeat protein